MLRIETAEWCSGAPTQRPKDSFDDHCEVYVPLRHSIEETPLGEDC
jgi:hypothetical protein